MLPMLSWGLRAPVCGGMASRKGVGDGSPDYNGGDFL